MWQPLSLGDNPSTVLKNGIPAGGTAGGMLLNASSALGDVPRTEPAGTWVYTAPTISSYAMSGSAMAKLDFGTLGGAEGNSDAFYYICEVAAYTDAVVVDHAADESLILTKMGIGFRIGIKAWNVDAKLTANLGMVAAAAELGSAQTIMEIHVFAGDIKQFAPVSDAAKFLTTKFNAESLKHIAGMVAVLTDVIVEKGASIPPLKVKYSEFRPNMYTPDRIIASNTYAIESLARERSRSQLDGWSADDGHKDWADTLSPSIIQCAYENFGVVEPLNKGTERQRKDAITLRNLGS